MRRLYHLPLSPFCRKLRLILAEKKLEVALIEERPWEHRAEFLRLNPAGQVPVLNDNGLILADSVAIAEYLEEAYPEPKILPGNHAERAEARRMAQWFDVKFHADVMVGLLHERAYKRLMRRGAPDASIVRISVQNLRAHLDYVGALVERRRWLAGDHLSLADFAAAAHLSSLDYCNEIQWEDCPPVREWYQRIKSRPAFRELLLDHVPGMPAPRHYADLDF